MQVARRGAKRDGRRRPYGPLAAGRRWLPARRRAPATPLAHVAAVQWRCSPSRAAPPLPVTRVSPVSELLLALVVLLLLSILDHLKEKCFGFLGVQRRGLLTRWLWGENAVEKVVEGCGVEGTAGADGFAEGAFDDRAWDF